MEAEFSAEELQLEKEVNSSLSLLEAAEATVAALQAQLEVTQEDGASVAAELRQLREVVRRWERAAEEGRRELGERESRLAELASVLPGGAHGEDECFEEEAPDEAEAKRLREVALAKERLVVLEKQTKRLEEQVSTQRAVGKAALKERINLERQADALLGERDGRRAEQRQARESLRQVEAMLQAREDEVAACHQRRRAIAREATRLRAELSGLQQQRCATSAAQAAETVAAAAFAAGAEGASGHVQPRAGAAGGHDAPSPPPAPPDTMMVGDGGQLLCGGPAAEEEVVPRPPSRCGAARAVSLQLQREIVKLWEALKHCDEEAIGCLEPQQQH